MPLWNFGRNIAIRPHQYCRPNTTDELLAFLDRHRNDERFRCVGRRHSWSRLLDGNQAIIDLSRFQNMELIDGTSGPVVRVGAGAQLKQIVSFLNRHQKSLPTLGLIDEQSIAGAISTGTHGSGRHSLSHYVQAVHLAFFDKESGKATTRWVTTDEWEELLAVRCSLGGLGVIIEVDLATRDSYRVEEHFRRYQDVAQVLAQEATYDLQQFYLVPWQWDYFAQHRRETESPCSWHAWLYRCFWLLGMDLGLHIWLVLLARWLPASATRFSYTQVIPRLVPQAWIVVDRSERQLTMQHELFRHIEVELFVPARHLTAALHQTRELLIQYAEKTGKARYVHHYPICVRRVLPDDTLISPASPLADQESSESWYTISIISYVRPGARASFEAFAKDLVAVGRQRFQARPHWGKYCPLDRQDVRDAYPHWDRFTDYVKQRGNHGRFLNGWLQELTDDVGYQETSLPTRPVVPLVDA